MTVEVELGPDEPAANRVERALESTESPLDKVTLDTGFDIMQSEVVGDVLIIHEGEKKQVADMVNAYIDGYIASMTATDEDFHSEYERLQRFFSLQEKVTAVL